MAPGQSILSKVGTVKESPPRIPSQWTTLHNLGLGVLVFPIFFFLLTQLPNLSVKGEAPKHTLLALAIVIPCFVMALSWHNRRIQRRHKLTLTLDGRQDDVFNGILIATGLLFFVLTGLSFPLNARQNSQRPPTGVTLEQVKKTKYMALHFEPSAKLPIVYINQPGLLGSEFHPTAGDTVFVSIQPGRLGINQISHLSWQSKEMTEPRQIYPRKSR